MPTLAELISYAVVNYVPYIILGLYPFANSLRYSRKKTAVLFYLYVAVTVSLFAGSYYVGGKCLFWASNFITLLTIFVYFASVKARKGRMLFHLFMIKNFANCVVVVGKYLESVLFPTTVGSMYHWTNTLCMLLVMIPLTPPILFVMSRYFTKQIRDSVSPTIWRDLWLIPVFFYAIWWFIYDYMTGHHSLQFALTPASSIFMLLYLSGQIFIYKCIAKLVISFNEKALLDEENHRLAEQSLQYKCINNHIAEIRRIKHDAKHRAVIIGKCLENKDYDRLKSLFEDYVNTFPDTNLSFCQNAPLNMLLVYYAQKCKEQQIQFDVNLNLPSELSIADSDIVIIFGNILENAFDACCTAPAETRKIAIGGSLLQNQYVFTAQNTFNGQYKQDRKTGEFLSTKHPGAAIGLSSIRNVTEKYHGAIQIAPKGDLFCLSLFIPV